MQHALMRLIDKWKKCLDASGIVGTILMEFSMAYDCPPHDLLIAKLEAYGFDFNSLCLMYSYLHWRHQRVKVGSHRSTAIRVKKLGSHKDPSLAHCSLTYLSMIYVS